jgi:hypothetical protein
MNLFDQLCEVSQCLVPIRLELLESTSVDAK